MTDRKQMIAWLRDKSARAGDHSHRRMLARAAEELADCDRATEQIRQMHRTSIGDRRKLLGEVLAVLGEKV